MSAVFLKLLNLSITASWLIMAVILVRFLLKKAPKRIICVLWALAAIRLVCPFSLESALSLIPSSETIPSNIEMMQKPAIDSGIPFINQAVNPVIANSLTPDPMTSANPLQIVIPVLSVVWIVGMAAMLLYAIISYLRLKKSVGASVSVRENILACDELKSPFILGIIKPLIYVPSSMNSKTLELVISHETAHIKRHDHWWKPFGFLILSVYWFNPLCWLAYVLLCRDIETACDEKVIRDMDKGNIAAYSQALLDCSFPRRGIAVCPLAFGEVGVKERVRSVLNYKKPTFWIILICVAACAVVAVCFMTNPHSVKIDDKMKVTLDTAIAAHNHSFNSDGTFFACAYDIFGVKKNGDERTVYAWVLHQEYVYSNSRINVISGSSVPVVFTVDTSESGNSSTYKIIDYWTPRDGSYYSDDIKDKFPMRMWSEVFEHAGNITSLEAECLRSAQEYFGGQSAFSTFTENTDGTFTADNGKTYPYGVAYANWTDDSEIYLRALNTDKMSISSVRHLPVYKFDTRAELDSFKAYFGGVLTMDQGYDEVPSFNYITAAYDDSFFSKYSLMLTYVSVGSGSYRFGVGDVYCDSQSFCVYVEQLNNPECYTDDMAGWFLVVEAEKEAIAECISYDAQL